MNKPKIYVSGPSRDLDRCEAAIALCRELGAEITYDWTVDVRANAGQSTPSDPDVQRTIALADLEGVAAADVMVFLDADNPSLGRWVEVGAAWGRGVPILASIPVGCRPYIWHQLMECTTSDESAIYRAVLVGRKRAARCALVGARFRQARERAGLSRAQARDLAGFGTAAIEDGTQTPSAVELATLARVYGVTACWLSGHDAPVDLTGLAEQAQDKGISPGDFAEIATMARTLALCASCHPCAVSSGP